MTRTEAIDYITNHVRPDSDEPVFVFLARDALAGKALDAYRDEIFYQIEQCIRSGNTNTALELTRKACGLFVTREQFRGFGPQRLPR